MLRDSTTVIIFNFCIIFPHESAVKLLIFPTFLIWFFVIALKLKSFALYIVQ